MVEASSVRPIPISDEVMPGIDVTSERMFMNLPRIALTRISMRVVLVR